MDYCFLSMGSPEVTVAALVAKDRDLRVILARLAVCAGVGPLGARLIRRRRPSAAPGTKAERCSA
eukprot:5039566-Alexandrium_andersonii.AAC.1